MYRHIYKLFWVPSHLCPAPFQVSGALRIKAFPYDFTSYVKSPEASGGVDTVEGVLLDIYLSCLFVCLFVCLGFFH